MLQVPYEEWSYKYLVVSGVAGTLRWIVGCCTIVREARAHHLLWCFAMS
jgi:hypothetical protein